MKVGYLELKELEAREEGVGGKPKPRVREGQTLSVWSRWCPEWQVLKINLADASTHANAAVVLLIV